LIEKKPATAEYLKSLESLPLSKDKRVDPKKKPGLISATGVHSRGEVHTRSSQSMIGGSSHIDGGTALKKPIKLKSTLGY